MMYKSVPACLISGILLNLSLLGPAQAETVEQRLTRLENLIGNQVLMEQSQQLQLIRQELTDIRAMVENQEHELNLIKQRQRNLYQDIDRRLHDLEVGGGGSGSSPGSAAPVPPPGASSVAPPSTGQATVEVPTPTGADTSDPDGKAVYTQAFNLLKEGRYQQAIIAFRNFLKTYPDSRYAANAQYWLGEANYVSRDYKTALQEFQTILSKYPDSNKIQGAELKIGYTYYEMNDWAEARKALQQVKTRYPNTPVARKADERLQRMDREGR